MTKFSTKHYDLIEEYKSFHKNGSNITAAESTFLGRSLHKWIIEIKFIIKKYNITSLIDYGCGKAVLYNEQIKIKKSKREIIYDNVCHFWGIEDYLLYDPGVEKYSTYPKSKKDLVICTDVLEHINPEDTESFILEILGLTKKVVFFVIELGPSHKKLKDGRNVHINLKTRSEWEEIFTNFQKKFNKIKFYVHLTLHEIKEKEKNLQEK